jgi:hypothetical protein
MSAYGRDEARRIAANIAKLPVQRDVLRYRVASKLT